ncbi:MAG: glycosyltransferase family 2 protein [Segetibacter sp.]|nr:glycosyltransferase family 2 protein [Segetibacter sp.]
MTQPLVSVLMTAYNRENYIAEAIESVLSSTYTHFECIIVDDKSNDRTYIIAKEYEKKDNRIRVYKNEKNLGDYPNRKHIASLASGKYIKFVDSDDVLYPHALEVMVRGMEQYPNAGLGMVWGDPIFEPSPKLYSPHEAFFSYFFKNQWMQVGPPGAIYKTACYKSVGGFDTLPYISDLDLNLKLGARWPVVRLQTDLFFYRIHQGQQLDEGQKLSGYPVLTYLIQKRHLELVECPLTGEEKKIAKNIIDKLQARRAFMHFLKSRSWKEFSYLVTESGLGWSGFKKGILQLYDF